MGSDKRTLTIMYINFAKIITEMFLKLPNRSEINHESTVPLKVRSTVLFLTQTFI